MDFIERIFHASPDHGDGTLEAAIVNVLVLLFFLLVFRVLWQRTLVFRYRRKVWGAKPAVRRTGRS